jgi:uncharacterized protein DUF6869
VKSRADLVNAWLRHDAASGEAQLLDRLVRYSAENGWRCVLALHRICQATGSDVSLAGWFDPMERLLHYHGGAVKDRFVDVAQRDVAFKARLAPLAESPTVSPDIIDALGAVCGWQRRSVARLLNPQIDRAAGMAELDISPPESADDWTVIDQPRDDAEFARLASAWLEQQALQWSSEAVSEVVTGGDPKQAWDLILELVRKAATDGALGAIGAGPIEDFVRLNGEAWIERIEREAGTDQKFCYALTWAWRGRTPELVWERIQPLTAACRRERYFE